ncbi:M20/M25/M40 family metallo-hydrolase [Acuticoccus mangrovi]|uniref:M20/M25/M40 family metallo-hydrolase n=1 Tax=Acuticoccus mangrovi TaxID=2796142 RepID=A0A934MEX9_9HYPH|nr:M20/M25/M40 family metallo-hydrolase [Acuticoccus mangrovi]MBJ3774868.1 M20/M25/M40 family metallo-hydrolase [Acuticoccus mangrovi]
MPFPDDRALMSAAMAREKAVVSLTQALVRCDTQNPTESTLPAADIAAAALALVPGITLEFHESDEKVVNLVARVEGGLPGRRLVFSGHIDTYLIGDPASWREPPLSGRIVDGRLYGRGAADMKGGCAALVEALRVVASARPFPGEVVLTLAGDEESMGVLGTKWLIDNVPIVHGDGVLVGDVGGPRCVRVGEKGMVWVTITATGRQAHGAHVYTGDNAIERLMRVLDELHHLEKLPANAPAAGTKVIDAARLIPGADGSAARRAMENVTINLGEIAGGLSPNLVPERAVAGIDIRLPLGVKVAEVEEALDRIIGAHPGVTHSIIRSYESTFTDPSAPIARVAREAIAGVLGEPVWNDMRIGGSDARLWRAAGFDTVVVGPTPRNLGGPDESVLVAELAPLTAIYALVAKHFLEGEG